jgi:dolichol-phosphate mannosyltransferase
VRVAVVIPCFRAKNSILAVLEQIGSEVQSIVVVDDGCPENSGDHVQANNKDVRVVVVRHSINQGVGAAVVSGYRKALELEAEIVVKLDADGQMDPTAIPLLISPIVSGLADYTKGNRFYSAEYLRSMPKLRLLGNSALSFLTKVSCGYWRTMDPTNGYTSVHAAILRALDLGKLEKRYFFETDLLFHLGLLRAVVWDIPMPACYAGEVSSLSIGRALWEFGLKHFTRLVSRISFSYFIREFQAASLLLLSGIMLGAFGTIFGSYVWYNGGVLGVPNTSGTVMLAALPCIIGFQFLLSFLNYDLAAVPDRPLHPMLEKLHTTQKSYSEKRPSPDPDS